MDKVKKRPGQQLLGGVAECPLEGRVDPLEVAVEARDAKQVERQIEDPLDLALGPPTPRDPAPDEDRDERRRDGPCDCEPGEQRLEPR